MKTKNKAIVQASLARAINEVIDRTASNLGDRNLNVHLNPATGKTKITPYGSDCEDGMYQLRWRVPLINRCLEFIF